MAEEWLECQQRIDAYVDEQVSVCRQDLPWVKYVCRVTGEVQVEGVFPEGTMAAFTLLRLGVAAAVRWVSTDWPHPVSPA